MIGKHRCRNTLPSAMPDTANILHEYQMRTIPNRFDDKNSKKNNELIINSQTTEEEFIVGNDFLTEWLSEWVTEEEQIQHMQ